MRDFEKISYEQFCKDVKEDKNLYDSYKLPIRDSIGTAGYDIFLLEDFEIKPGEIVKLPKENKIVNFKAGDAVVQGIFMKILTTKSDNILGIE